MTTALVTGASAGIGEAFVKLIAARGDDVIVVARDQARLETLRATIEKTFGTRVEVLAADLTQSEGVARVEARLSDKAAPVDLLINNAGFGTFGRFAELDVTKEVQQIELNVMALVRLTHAALGPMAARGAGAVLNVSSMASFQACPGNATYSATKAFVTSFTRALHLEMKPLGVTVSVLCPGFTRTEFQARAGVNDKHAGAQWMDADTVANAGLEGVKKGTAEIVPGLMNRVGVEISARLPRGLAAQIAGRVLRETL